MAKIIIKYRGRKYYLHKRGEFIYPSKEKIGALEELPEGYKIVTKGSTPYVKKI